MKKRLLSIILTAFLVLSMVPYAAFADSSIVCPACGGSVTKQERRLLTAHDDFFKCDKCGKWAWANKLGSLSLFSVGDQQILEAADSSGLLNFSFNNGHLISAEKAPSGIGRKDLPGYADDNGTPIYNVSGKLQLVIEPYGIGTMNGDNISSGLQSNDYVIGSSGSGTKYIGHGPSIYGASDTRYTNPVYYFTAPVSGVYYIGSAGSPYNFGNIDLFYDNSWHSNSLVRNYSDEYKFSRSMNKGDTCTLTISSVSYTHLTLPTN